MDPSPLVSDPSMTQQPAEVQMGILRHISTYALLNSCRFVCRQWNDLSVFICRERHVHFRSTEFFQNSTRILGDTFQDVLNVPWSSMDLTITRNSSKRIDSLKPYGNQVRSLSVTLTPSVSTTGFKPFLTFLSDQPRLSALEIIITSVKAKRSSGLVFPTEAFQLPRLKALALEFGKGAEENGIQLLDFLLLHTGNQVTSLHLDLRSIPKEYFVRILTILAAANPETKLSLELNYSTPQDKECIAQLVDQRSLNIFKLTIGCSGQDGVSSDYFRVLETFLANHEELRELHLRDFTTLRHFHSKYFRIPHLPRLEVLEYNSEEGFDYFLSHFHPLVPKQFPCLKSVFLLRTGAEEKYVVFGQARMFGVAYSEPPTAIFDTVQVLTINAFEKSDGWCKVFPNLVTFDTTVKEEEDLTYIFQEMENLKELFLTIRVDYENINTFLSSCLRTSPNFKGLKRLTLTIVATKRSSPDHLNVLQDSGAILMNLFDPLMLVIIAKDPRVSDTCISRLRSYHREFEIQKY